MGSNACGCLCHSTLKVCQFYQNQRGSDMNLSTKWMTHIKTIVSRAGSPYHIGHSWSWECLCAVTTMLSGRFLSSGQQYLPNGRALPKELCHMQIPIINLVMVCSGNGLFLHHIGPGVSSTIKTIISPWWRTHQNSDVTCRMPVIVLVRGTVSRSRTCIYGVLWGGFYPPAVTNNAFWL